MTATGREAATHRASHRGTAWPWLVALVPTAAWFAHLNASYLLVPVTCRAGHPWWSLAATLAALGLAGTATAGSWRTWRAEGRAATDRDAGLVGLLLGALFLLAIVGLGVSNVVVDPCR